MIKKHIPYNTVLVNNTCTCKLDKDAFLICCVKLFVKDVIISC